MASLKVRMKITNKCESTCWYCSSNEKNTIEISSEMIDVILKKLRDLYFVENRTRIKFGLTGGNPFNTYKIVELMDKIRAHLKGIDVYTLADVSYHADLKIVEQYVNRFGGCLLSLNEDPIEDIVEMAQIISSFACKKGLFTFNVLLTPFNISRMDKIIDHVLKHRLPLRLDHLFGTSNGSNLEMIECVDSIFDRLKKEGFNRYSLYNFSWGLIHPLKRGSEDYCGYGAHAYHFDVHGNVRRCHVEKDPVSTVFDDKLHETIKCENFYYKKKNCSGCDVFEFCRGGCYQANKNGEYCEFYYRTIKHVLDLYKKTGLI